MQKGYQSVLMTEDHKKQIEKRQPLSYQEYLDFYHQTDSSADNIVFPLNNKGPYRLVGIKDHKRYYQKL